MTDAFVLGGVRTPVVTVRRGAVASAARRPARPDDGRGVREGGSADASAYVPICAHQLRPRESLSRDVLYRDREGRSAVRLEACLHGVLQALDVAHGHGQCGVSNQPERLDRWYSIAQLYAQPQAGIGSEGDAAIHK